MRTLHDVEHRHHGWNRDRPALIEVAPGEELELVLADCFDGQLGAAADAAAVEGLQLERANPLTGPVRVAGAQPGDALGIEVLDLEVGAVGWTALIPGFGLLADDFPAAHVVVSQIGVNEVEVGGFARLARWPFLGTVGLAPQAPGDHSVIPPRRVGGNLDCRDVRPGATLWLPVEVAGGLLSVGDPHAAQGDGEVCGTAVETTAVTRLRLQLRPGQAPPAPRIELPAAASGPPAARGPRWLTTGVGPDLYAAARQATRAMIDELTARYGLDAPDAYVLCSVAGDLRIAEVVDAPNWVVVLDLDLGVLG